jgi:2-haloalkanoic acid dehalogenase type II
MEAKIVPGLMEHDERVRLSDFKVLSFDCYGTLIDWETGICEAAPRLLSAAGSRDLLLESFGRHEPIIECANPGMIYSEILREVYAEMAGEFGVKVSRLECVEFGESVRKWPAFPDSADALAHLNQHFVLAILSNVDRQSFNWSEQRLGVEFSYVFTAQDIGSYKPDPRNFEYLVSKLGQEGFEKGDILHVAESLYHDHGPANNIGLASTWIHRRHASDGFGATATPKTMPHYDFRFTSMAELAEAYRQEVS